VDSASIWKRHIELLDPTAPLVIAARVVAVGSHAAVDGSAGRSGRRFLISFLITFKAGEQNVANDYDDCGTHNQHNPAVTVQICFILLHFLFPFLWVDVLGFLVLLLGPLIMKTKA
jgi:hypothetical protein